MTVISTVTLKCNECGVEHVGAKIVDGVLEQPEGWKGLAWRPGLLRRPDEKPSPAPKHFCSDACLTTFKTRTDWRAG